MTEPAVRFEKITRRFPGVQALSDVSLEIAAGSCHALCGENGAGKSTLGKILAGIHKPDAGRLFVHGREANFDSPRDALAAGVGMVHQELAFCENLSVAENLCLGSLPSRGGLLDRNAMASRAAAMLAEIGTTFDVWRPVGSLTIAQQQMVQIAMAVSGGAKIIIFDEPTSSLSQVEADRLYELIGRLTARGVACIYVSHRMPEVFRLCDTVTVLRDGQHVGTRPIEGLSEHELVQMMIGRPLAEYVARRESVVIGNELLRVEGLSSPGKFENVSFSLRAGEVLGIAGLVGAGRSELAQALFGLDPVRRGTIVIGGQPARLATPAEAIALGIGLVPEDRKRQGSCRRRAACTTSRSRSCGAWLASAGYVGAKSDGWRRSSSSGSASAPRPSTPSLPGYLAETSRRSSSRAGSPPIRGCSFSTSRRAASTSARRRRSTR